MKLHIDNFGMLWCDKKIIASFNPIIRYQKKAMQDAQTIAHRVNCFEELVAMLEYARESINQSASIFNNSRFTDRHQDGPRCIRAMEAISAALERAKT